MAHEAQRPVFAQSGFETFVEVSGWFMVCIITNPPGPGNQGGLVSVRFAWYTGSRAQIPEARNLCGDEVLVRMTRPNTTDATGMQRPSITQLVEWAQAG